ALSDETGAAVPFLAEGIRRHPDDSLARVTLTFRAEVPALGYRSYWASAVAGPGPGGEPGSGADATGAGGGGAGGSGAGGSGAGGSGADGSGAGGSGAGGSGAGAGWTAVPGTVIANEAFEVAADPARGGGLSRITDRRTGTELLRGLGNELV